MVAQIIIKFLGVNDYPQVLRIFYQLHKIHSDLRPDYYLASDTPITRERYAQFFEEPGARILGAMDGEKLIGMCFLKHLQRKNPLECSRKVLYLDDICVDEEYRRQGIGELLCQKATEIAEEENVDAVELGVWYANRPAVALYEKMGFVPRTMRMERLLVK